MRGWALLVLIFLFSTQAQATFLKIGALGGFGQFTAQREDLSGSEGPLAFAVTLDYDINSRWSLGAEHLRSFSMSPLGTSISQTGFTGRWYYLSPVPNALDFNKPYLRARVLQKGFFPYVGWSAGFAQASIVNADNKKSVIALSLSVAAKAGVDYPIMNKFALRYEINLGFPMMGTGSVSYYALNVGGLYFW